MAFASPYSPFFTSGLHSRHSSLPESLEPSSLADDSFIEDERSLYPTQSVASSSFLSLDLAAPSPRAERLSKTTKRSSGLLPSFLSPTASRNLPTYSRSNDVNPRRTQPLKKPPTAPLPASPTLTSSKPMSPPVHALTLVASHTHLPEDILHLVPGDSIIPTSNDDPYVKIARTDKRESTSTRNTNSTGRTVSTHYRTTKRDDALAALEGLRRMRSTDTLRFTKFKARAIAKAQRERAARGTNWISMSDDEDDETSFWRTSIPSTSKLVSSWRLSSISSRTASPAEDDRRQRVNTRVRDFDTDMDYTLGFEALCNEPDHASAEDSSSHHQPHAFARSQPSAPLDAAGHGDESSSADGSDELDGFIVVHSPYIDPRGTASDTGLVIARSSAHLAPSLLYEPPSPAHSAPTHRANKSTPSFLRPPSLLMPGRKSSKPRSSHVKSSSDKSEKSSRKLKSFIDLRPPPRVTMGRSFVEVW